MTAYHLESAAAWPDDVPPPPSGDSLPYDDGEPMESDLHRAQMHLSVELAKNLLSGGRGYATGNLALYFSATQARNQDFKAPDVMIFLDVEDRPRRSWVVWEEGGRVPDVVIELLSDSTRKTDLGPKKDTYAWLHVTEYFVWDPMTAELMGWRLDGARYSPLRTGQDGRLESKVLGVGLGPAEMRWGEGVSTFLRFFQPDGTPVPTRAEAEAQRAEAEAQRAEAEAQRADAAEAELARLKAELAALRGA